MNDISLMKNVQSEQSLAESALQYYLHQIAREPDGGADTVAELCNDLIAVLHHIPDKHRIVFFGFVLWKPFLL